MSGHDQHSPFLLSVLFLGLTFATDASSLNMTPVPSVGVCSLGGDFEIELFAFPSVFTTTQLTTQRPPLGHTQPPKPVTVATHVSIDRLGKVIQWCESWRGPISVSVRLENHDQHRQGMELRQIIKRNHCLQSWVDFHLVSPSSSSQGEHSTNWPVIDSYYPFNTQRNVAFMGVLQGHHALLVDADMMWRLGKKEGNGLHGHISSAFHRISSIQQELVVKGNLSPSAKLLHKALVATNHTPVSKWGTDPLKTFFTLHCLGTVAETYLLSPDPGDAKELDVILRQQSVAHDKEVAKRRRHLALREERANTRSTATDKPSLSGSLWKPGKPRKWGLLYKTGKREPDRFNGPHAIIQPFYYDHYPQCQAPHNLTLPSPRLPKNLDVGSTNDGEESPDEPGDYDDFLAQSIPFTMGYEPFALFSAHSLSVLPPLDESFTGRCYDKSSYFYQLDLQGWRGFALPYADDEGIARMDTKGCVMTGTPNPNRASQHSSIPACTGCATSPQNPKRNSCPSPLPQRQGFGFLINRGRGDQSEVESIRVEFRQTTASDEGNMQMHGEIMWRNFRHRLDALQEGHALAQRKGRPSNEGDLFLSQARNLRTFLEHWSSFTHTGATTGSGLSTGQGYSCTDVAVDEHTCSEGELREISEQFPVHELELQQDKEVDLLLLHVHNSTENDDTDASQHKFAKLGIESRRTLHQLADFGRDAHRTAASPSWKSIFPRKQFLRHKLDWLVDRWHHARIHNRTSMLSSSGLLPYSRRVALETCNDLHEMVSPKLYGSLEACENHVRLCVPGYPALTSTLAMTRRLKDVCERLGNLICNRVVFPLAASFVDTILLRQASARRTHQRVSTLKRRWSLTLASSMHYQLYRCRTNDAAEDFCNWGRGPTVTVSAPCSASTLDSLSAELPGDMEPDPDTKQKNVPKL